MPVDSRILVLLVVPGNPQETTPLQGFAASLCKNPWMVELTLLIPSSIFDLTPMGQQAFLSRRISGGNPINWFGQTPRAIKAQRVPHWAPFVLVIVPPEADAKEYVEWARKSVVPPIIIAETEGDLTFAELTIDKLQSRFLHACNLIPKSNGERSIEAARKAIQSWSVPSQRPLGYQVGGHNSIAPNVHVLQSAGFTEIVYGRFDKTGQGLEAYTSQIVSTTNSIFELRDNVNQGSMGEILPRTIDLNLFAPATFPFIFSVSPPSSLPKAERDKFILARRMLERQSGYGFTSQTPAQIETMIGDLSQAEKTGTIAPHPLFRLRQEELTLATECMSILAVSELSGTVRLPNDANRASGAVRNFAAVCRSAAPSPRKRVSSFRQVQEYLRRAVPSEFFPLIRRSQTGIRIIADAHLEWLDVDGLPLCIRKNVTRIPVTPGNLFVQMAAAHWPLLLSVDDFREILVINALDRTDEIRRAFEIAMEAFEPSWRGTLKITFKEVSNADELAAALDAFNGPLAVFDGHGGHENNKVAKLFLKGQPIDVWDLKEKLTSIPPIVVLSACDTHAADRNHATSGNGFLSLGARTVLASVFPLHAVDAAAFVARLLFRVAAYLPIAAEALGRAISWNEVVSGMVRMQLLTDYLRHLERSGLIDEPTYLEVHEAGNNAINGGRQGPPSSDPFADVDQMLVQTVGLKAARLKSAFETALTGSSALSYLQLGRPETISIISGDKLKEFNTLLASAHEANGN